MRQLVSTFYRMIHFAQRMLLPLPPAVLLHTLLKTSLPEFRGGFNIGPQADNAFVPDVNGKLGQVMAAKGMQFRCKALAEAVGADYSGFPPPSPGPEGLPGCNRRPFSVR